MYMIINIKIFKSKLILTKGDVSEFQNFLTELV